jgi:hypothetical protein
MKKSACLVLFLLIAAASWAKSPLSFSRFALDDDKTATIKIIEKDFKGKYTLDEEWDGYIITLEANKTLYVYFENERISSITVEFTDMKYTDYLALVGKIVDKYGDPKGAYIYDEIMTTYWWPKNPSFDMRIYITLGSPFTVRESVFYGK